MGRLQDIFGRWLDRLPRGWRRTAYQVRLLAAIEQEELALVRPWSGYGDPPSAVDHALPADTFVVVPARHEVVYRLVGHEDARDRDFRSNWAKNRPQAPDETYADYLGLSVFGSEDLAFKNASRWPKHVAVVLLPREEGFSIARTYPEIEGHYTIWGGSERLLANVERVATKGELDRLEGE